MKRAVTEAQQASIAQTAKEVSSATLKTIIYINCMYWLARLQGLSQETCYQNSKSMPLHMRFYVQILLAIAFGYLIVSGIAQIFHASLRPKYGHPTAAAVKNVIRIIGVGALATAIAGGVAS